MPEVKEIRELEGVEVTRGDMCAFGLYQDTEKGRRLVMKPTGFMTNAQVLGEELSKKSTGTTRT